MPAKRRYPSAEQADYLSRLTEILAGQVERGGWASLSEGSFQRVWGNDEDAAYDDWQDLYSRVAR